MLSHPGVQRTYFPMPSFCSQYWSYPEVQNAKEELLTNINRDSPEEKISDLYWRMQGNPLMLTLILILTLTNPNPNKL